MEDPRERSWLVDVPDVPLDERGGPRQGLSRGAVPPANGIGYRGSPLGAKRSGLPANYRIEISRLTALLDDELGILIRDLGADRIVFGTGMPFNYPDPALLKLQVMSAGEEDRQRIAWKNVATWLE